MSRARSTELPSARSALVIKGIMIFESEELSSRLRPLEKRISNFSKDERSCAPSTRARTVTAFFRATARYPTLRGRSMERGHAAGETAGSGLARRMQVESPMTELFPVLPLESAAGYPSRCHPMIVIIHCRAPPAGLGGLRVAGPPLRAGPRPARNASAIQTYITIYTLPV